MKKLGQGTQSKRQTQREKAWWVCLIAALSFCLWGTNLLPLQNLEYQLTTNLAISQHRLPILHRLAANKVPNAFANAPISSIELLADDESLSNSANSELRSVRVKVRCAKHCDLRFIERALQEMTKPSMESAESQEFAKKLLKEQWLLESCAHSLKRLELDREREVNAVNLDDDELDEVAVGETNSNPPTTPFRLASYGSTDNVDQSQSGLMDNLRQLNQIRTQNVDSMNMMLERLKAQALGFLSITGSPNMAPLVRPLTFPRLFVLFALCISVWGLLMFWLQPIGHSRKLNRRKPSQGPRSLRNQKQPITSFAAQDDFSTIGAQKTIHWLQRRGIPYLGAIQIEFEDRSLQNAVMFEPSASDESVASKALANEDDEQRVEPIVHFHPSQLLRSLGEGSLVLWLGLFVARLLFDPLWRELVAVAQLAAISRMISGI